MVGSFGEQGGSVGGKTARDGTKVRGGTYLRSCLGEATSILMNILLQCFHRQLESPATPHPPFCRWFPRPSAVSCRTVVTARLTGQL